MNKYFVDKLEKQDSNGNIYGIFNDLGECFEKFINEDQAKAACEIKNEEDAIDEWCYNYFNQLNW